MDVRLRNVWNVTLRTEGAVKTLSSGAGMTSREPMRKVGAD
jgi:hypothetical protein